MFVPAEAGVSLFDTNPPPRKLGTSLKKGGVLIENPAQNEELTPTLSS